MEKQIKSKNRVTDFGEVYTAKKQVVAMINLISEDIETIGTTVLEPACGNGNFLVEILSRKLNTIRTASDLKYNTEGFVLQAISSIYGVDIQADNVFECRERMLNQVIQSGLLRSDGAKRMAEKILQHNLICGNTLTMLDARDKPMRIPEWNIWENGTAVRKEVLFSDMAACGGNCQRYIYTHKYFWKAENSAQSA